MRARAILLFLLFVIGVVGGVLYYLDANKDKDSESEATQDDYDTIINDNNKKLEEELGFTESEVDDVRNTAKDAISEMQTCLVYPDAYGECEGSMKVKDGCCDFKGVPGIDGVELASKIIIMFGVGQLIDFVVERTLIYGFSTLGSRLAARAAAKAATQAAAKAATQTAVKAGGKVAVQAGSRTASQSVMQVILSTPASTAIGAAMMMLTAVSITLDIIDPSGYNTYLPNGDIKKQSNIISYYVEKMCAENGLDYPMIFPISMVFIEEYQAAFAFVFAEMGTKIVDRLASNEETAESFVNILLGEATQDDYDTYGTVGMEVINENFEERDRILYDKMVEALPSGQKSYVSLYSKISSKGSSGVSLSKEGAEWWNAKHYNDWMAHAKLGIGGGGKSDLPDDYEPPMVALYTDNYMQLNTTDPGGLSKPNMVMKKLPVKTCLALPIHIVMAHCERPKSTRTMRTTIDPGAYNVKFNPDTQMCDYTNSYCREYGLDTTKKKKDGYEYTECDIGIAQEYVGEMLIGTTIVREADKFFTEGPAGGVQFAAFNCSDENNEIRQAFKNPNNRCVNLRVKDKNGNRYMERNYKQRKPSAADVGKAAGTGAASGAIAGAMFCGPQCAAAGAVLGATTAALTAAFDKRTTKSQQTRLCKNGRAVFCVPEGGHVDVKGTTYMCGKKLARGVISYNEIMNSEQYRDNKVMHAYHTPCATTGKFKYDLVPVQGRVLGERSVTDNVNYF